MAVGYYREIQAMGARISGWLGCILPKTEIEIMREA
jgi:hypothetical protein